MTFQQEFDAYYEEMFGAGRSAEELLAAQLANNGTSIPGGTGHPYNTPSEHKTYKVTGFLSENVMCGAESPMAAAVKLRDELLRLAREAASDG